MSEQVIVKNRRKTFWFAACFALLAGYFCAGKYFVSSAQNGDSLAPAAVRFSQNFDGVVAPALPAGWTVTNTGTGSGFVTTTNIPDTAPNAVFTASPATTSGSDLTSPVIYVTSANTILNFRHKYAMENTWDGGILEISIAGGAFQDITEAGGTFISGGYNNFLNISSNPIGNRFAWTGATPGTYISTSIQLPSAVFRQNIQLRWRFGSNDSFGSDGWWIDTITLETISTGANPASITIPASGAASIYPSEVQVSGMNGFVSGIVVDLGNFSHTSPDDVDIMLVAPNGRSLVLMSDAGGTMPAGDVGITFDDSAPTSLPDNGPLTSNTYKPTNYEPGDAFPAPAPQNPTFINSLSGFYGSTANGTWRLYVVDDTGANAGMIAGGWSLTLQTSTSACPFDISANGQSFPNTGGAGSFQITMPAGCNWTATTNSSFVNITTPAGDSNGTINFTVAPNTGGARTASIIVSNGLASRTFLIQQSSGCPTGISPFLVNFPSSGGTGVVNITAAQNCTWSASVNVNWLTIPANPQTGNGIISITASENQSQNPRSATITVGNQTILVVQAKNSSIGKFDFDGDRRADIGVFRAGNWYLQQSTNGFSAAQFGLATDEIAPADYDGDGKTDYAVFRDGIWYVLQSSNGALRVFYFGTTGDRPLPADFDGNGQSEITVYRPSNGGWFALRDGGYTTLIQPGNTDLKPVPADYDGDGRTDVGIFRDGVWMITNSSEGYRAVNFGMAGDKPVAADYDGDGRADIAVYRGGNWYILQSRDGYKAVQFGLPSDQLVPADYDGDAKTDIAVFRAGNWYILQSQQGFRAAQFGLANDKPISLIVP